MLERQCLLSWSSAHLACREGCLQGRQGSLPLHCQLAELLHWGPGLQMACKVYQQWHAKMHLFACQALQTSVLMGPMILLLDCRLK